MKPTVKILALSFFIFSACTGTEMAVTENPVKSRAFEYGSVVNPDWYNPQAMDTITVVTWNVEHFVDMYDNPYIDNSRENNPPDNLIERQALLGEAIRKMDADIVVFQELESDSYLQDMSEIYFRELGYQIFAAHESNDWYMNVVIMSRIPLGLFHSYATVNTAISGQTDDAGNPESQTFINNRMWTAEVMVKEDYRFTLTGLHLKAGRGERNEAWRTGQIELLRDHLGQMKTQDPDMNMLIAGDLNMTPDSPEFNLLQGNEESGLYFIDPLEGTGIFSHPSDSVFWRIDHILIEQSMKPEWVPGSSDVIYPLSKEKMEIVSDHLPVIARFVTTDK